MLALSVFLKQLISVHGISELILDDARHVFEDVTEHFSNVASLKQKFERWKQDFGESYEQAYIPLCLVKLLVPFVRLQMVAWNPIEVGQCVFPGRL